MREELILSAINFLSDPQVAASPLEKRIAFLRSKNLTQEEIDASLRRVGEAPAAGAMVPSTGAPQMQQQYPPQYPPGNYYPAPQQRADYPNRDWRDWFIMATVTGSVGYGLYYLSKRYIYPLIAPPTPPQLEADKLSIDAKFTQAFDILDTLKTDTAALKLAEEDRKARVDAALEEVESVVQDLKNAGKRREDESKRVGDEVRGLRDLIPKALEGQKEQQKKALEDLQNELKSLKQLVMNRTAPARPAYTPSGIVGTPPLDPGAASSAPSAPTPAPQPMNGGMNGGMGGMGGMGTMGSQGPAGGLASIMGGMKDNSAPSPAAAPRGYGTGKPSIPAWQMAASRANAAPAAPAPAAAGSSKEGESSS